MCSISGFLSNKKLNKETAKRLSAALIFYGQSRGRQSAGGFTVGNTMRLAKRAISPNKFIMSNDFDALFKDDVKVGLFHTRFPTCGEKTDKQAQPFHRSETVSIHNGYYFDISGIKNMWGLTKNSGVDSELVTDFIESYGIKMLPQFMASTDGPSAIAAYHKGKMYLARGGNPLHYCPIDIDGCKVVVFASTFEQLDNAIKYTVLEEYPNIRELKENRVYEVGTKQLRRIGTWEGEVKRRPKRNKKKKGKKAKYIEHSVSFDMDSLIDKYSMVFDDDDDKIIDLVDIMEENNYNNYGFPLDDEFKN